MLVPMLKKGLFLFALLGTVLFFFSSPRYAYRLTIGAMFKNEAPWLKEWIVYHHEVLGVEHFYLYNNDSTDDYRAVLEPFIKAGLVELIDWSSSDPANEIPGEYESPWLSFQVGAYNDCLKKKAYRKARWVAIIDIDEFIVPVHGVDSFWKFLDAAEKRRKGSLKFMWRNFGTSSVWRLEEGEFLTQKLVRRYEDDTYMNNWCKSIHCPEAIVFCSIHDTGKLAPHYRRGMADPSEIRIHHYWTRTEEECEKKRGLARPEADQKLEEGNHVLDETMLQYSQMLQKGMEKWDIVD